MKIHITNLYNFNNEDKLVQRQHKFADAGRSLGFYEMGIFSYPVETDTVNELSKRLDGIIAALEAEDIVIIQLPTKNGIKYEQLLIDKIKAYRNTKIVLLVHDIFLSQLSYEEKKEYERLYNVADSVNDSIEEYQINNDFMIKKVLLDELASVFSLQKNYDKTDTNRDENEVHIGFGLHDRTGNYSVWVGVAMQSIIENTGAKVCFHVLHDESLTDKNKKRLIQVAEPKGHKVLFQCLSAELFSDFIDQVAGYTIGSMFRIVLPELFLELNRIIYLDADVLVNRDIKELWDTDIQDYCMAAVPDLGVVNGGVRPIPVKQNIVSKDRYFNSGVLYMNLERIRNKGNMKDMIMEYLLKTKESDMPDQDALNAIYNEETLLLNASWNCFAQHVRRNGEKELQRKIYHYVGTPCILYSLTGMDLLYFETTRRTPWGEEECRKQLMDSLVRINDRITQFEQIIPQISDCKVKRIFYGKETLSMRNMYNLLSLREGDYRILADDSDEKNGILPCKNFEVLITEREKFVVFVLPEADNWSAIERLEQLGLVNEKDFFVIPRILPSYQGGYVR